ncbi:hypothetical protein [Dactylosporangium sp. CA-233914]|uniref:hypothetical protein n=1 Tax=Dactylosporangium sp. CA-233914 TaxID=3239934 RepID=UPI003D92AAFD
MRHEVRRDVEPVDRAAPDELVLNDGWSFAELGRALGVTRQAASKAYAAPVEQRMRHNIRRRDTALVIVACGGAKLDRPAPAADLYVGSYHQACRRAAERLGGRLVSSPPATGSSCRTR